MLCSFLKLRPSNPQEKTVTALLHLRITQHSSSMPQNSSCIPWIASLQAQEGWRVRLSSAVKECNHYICVHPGTQRSNSIEALTLPPWTWKTGENRDLSGFERTPQPINIFQAFVVCFCVWSVGCCWGFFIFYKRQFFPLWLHRVLPDPRMLQHSHLTNFLLPNLLKGNKKNKTFVFNRTDVFVKLDGAGQAERCLLI